MTACLSGAASEVGCWPALGMMLWITGMTAIRIMQTPYASGNTGTSKSFQGSSYSGQEVPKPGRLPKGLL